MLMVNSWSFNTDKSRFDFVELNARLDYPCFHLRWDVSIRPPIQVGP